MCTSAGNTNSPVSSGSKDRTTHDLHVDDRMTSGLLEGSLVGSSRSIQRWAKADLTNNLKAFIEHEKFRLKVIKNNMVRDYEKNHSSSISLTNNHPTSVFVSMRNFLGNWKDKLENSTVYGKRLREFLSVDLPSYLPSKSDLDLASASIGLLQAAYNISTKDIILGRILGYQGAKLNSADCYDIGKSAFRSGVLDTAYDWLRTAVDLPPKFEKFKVDKRLTFNLSDALMHLGKISYQKKDKDLGLKMMEKALELDPENVELNQEFLKYRSGWQVVILPDLNRESMEPWRRRFFDKCQEIVTNATANSTIPDHNLPTIPHSKLTG
ncbi:vacuolar protein sorting 37b [Plakobranchus ocellatus]|uniref:Vacuolar protein sorting 37b n=1 Tax=Plakobranchus ocellatus TaxID=259542 RepID=A0AAV4DJM1_9GAST|nr:vacuolar protein sorting 37b [Plakobranchus ocellatus]